MVMLTGLADGLRKHGLTVIEIDGWKTRGWAGRGLYGTPKGVLHHHTATTSARRYSTGAPTLNMLIGGRSDLPGPLCNLAFGRGGEVYVVAAGWANHAGVGGPIGGVPLNAGNGWLIGIEAESSGVAPADWTADQIRVWPYLASALARMYKPASPNTFLQLAHYEWSSMGKIDASLLPDRIEGLRSAQAWVTATGTHAWSYANPTGKPKNTAAAQTPAEPAAPAAPNETKDWFTMATKEDLRAVVREELKNEGAAQMRGSINHMIPKIVTAVLDAKIPAKGSATGQVTVRETLGWGRHDRVRSESADKAIAAALDKERLEQVVADAVAAAQADTVTVVSDARVTRQVPATQIKEVQA